ncbi:hypothetical protein [Elioraea sp.]|uniref:hypothetical protein n=1 Tax=Elioraea sp. TaxID=2185103 RepID=UPI0025C07A1A|nr:hypothetical protein [Elioraea sp.]
MTRPTPWLTAVLVTDAIGCLALGLVATGAPGLVGGLTGLPRGFIVPAGAVLLAAAAVLIVTAAQRSVSLTMLRVVAIGNAAWVLASVATLVLMPMTTLGVVFVGVQAIAVAVLAVLEARPLVSVRAAGAA